MIKQHKTKLILVLSIVFILILSLFFSFSGKRDRKRVVLDEILSNSTIVDIHPVVYPESNSFGVNNYKVRLDIDSTKIENGFELDYRRYAVLRKGQLVAYIEERQPFKEVSSGIKFGESLVSSRIIDINEKLLTEYQGGIRYSYSWEGQLNAIVDDPYDSGTRLLIFSTDFTQYQEYPIWEITTNENDPLVMYSHDVNGNNQFILMDLVSRNRWESSTKLNILQASDDWLLVRNGEQEIMLIQRGDFKTMWQLNTSVYGFWIFSQSGEHFIHVADCCELTLYETLTAKKLFKTSFSPQGIIRASYLDNSSVLVIFSPSETRGRTDISFLDDKGSLRETVQLEVSPSYEMKATEDNDIVNIYNKTELIKSIRKGDIW